MRQATIIAIIGLTLVAGTAQAGEYVVNTIKDRHGIRTGTIEQRPDGQVVIKDRHGIRQGTIESKDGKLIVKDRWGLPKAKIERTR